MKKSVRIIFISVSALLTILTFQNCGEVKFNKSSSSTTTEPVISAAAETSVALSDQTVFEGETATFFAQVSNSPENLAFVWSKEGTPLNSSSDSSLVISDAQSSDQGEYTVDVFDGELLVATAKAVLTVVTLPVVEPTRHNLVLVNDTREWSDGTYSKTCHEYLNPSDPYYYEGETGDGYYMIDPDGNGSKSAFKAYCDMDGSDGWTRIIASNSSLSDLANFGSTSQISSTYSIGSLGVGWGKKDDSYKSFTAYIPFNRVKVRYSAYYGGSGGGLGWMYISDGSETLLNSQDAWWLHSSGQSLQVKGSYIYKNQRIDETNVLRSINSTGSRSALTIGMKGWTSYQYNMRRIKELWVR